MSKNKKKLKKEKSLEWGGGVNGCKVAVVGGKIQNAVHC